MSLSTSKLFKTEFANNGKLHKLTDDERNIIQDILFQMLCIIDKVCVDNNIPYCLCGGSALGALRHNGFIPWDDDLDIFMFRNDIIKFANIINCEYGDIYEVKTPGLNDYWESPSTTICKKGTVFMSYGEIGESNPGVCCDICILENAPDNKILRYIHGVGSMLYKIAVSCRRFYRDKDKLLKYCSDNKKIKKSIKIKAAVGKVLSVFSYEQYIKKMYMWNSKYKLNNTEYVVCPNGRAYYFGEIYNRSILSNAHRHVFRDIKVYIPENSGQYLANLYGNYMEIPKVNDREMKIVFELKL